MKKILYNLIFSFAILGCMTDQKKTVGEELTVDKKIRIPQKVWMVPDSNDYNDPDSRYSFSRFKDSKNLGIFWDSEYGDNPSENKDVSKTFNIDSLLLEGDRFIDYYINDLQFLEKGKSTTDSTKILMYVFGGDDGTAYGSGKDSIGLLWSPAVRVHKPPYGALAHEIGHSFQYLVSADGHYGFKDGGSIWEMTSQWMLWQVYPTWIDFENYHLEAFLNNTYRAFLHEENMYHSPFVLEYWSNKHGKTFLGELWRNSRKGEDPVLTYKRITKIDQKTFNDEIFDASRKFVTWDFPRIEDVSRKYANIHHTNLEKTVDGWYLIDEKEAPQNYGYNAIALSIPDEAKVTAEFKGITNHEKFNIQDPDLAGWRYGFLAVDKAGNRNYGPVYSDQEKQIEFRIPENTKHLWFVVSGAPQKHKIHIIDHKAENDEQWPYKVKFLNTDLKK